MKKQKNDKGNQMALNNPYMQKGIIPMDSCMFFGRDKEIREIEEKLSRAAPQCVSIIGEHFIGKSSLAFRVYHKIKQNGNSLAIYLDSDKIAGQCQNPDQFFKLVDLEFRAALKKNPGFNPGKEGADFFHNYPSFAGFIKKTAKQGVNTIIFIDNFERLIDQEFAGSGFFPNLWTTALKRQNRLAFVTISIKEPGHLLHQPDICSPSREIFAARYIGLLDQKSIHALRNKGFENAGIYLNEEEKQTIHYYAGDFPFFNQLVCGFILEAKIHGLDIDRDGLELIVHPYYKALWEIRTGKEKEILVDPGNIKPGSEADLKRMEIRGLLVKKDHGYIPFSGFFEDSIGRDLKTLKKRYLEAANQDPENIQALRNLKNAYEKTGEESKAFQVKEILHRLIDRNEFVANLGKTIILEQLQLRGLHFFDDFTWRIQPSFNVLSGRNGSGKTYLLRLAAALLQKNTDLMPGFFKNSSKDSFARLCTVRNGELATILRNKVLFQESFGKVPLLAIPDMRILDKSRTVIGIPDEEKTDLKQDGAYHFLYEKSPERIILTFLYQLCITYLETGKHFNSPVFEFIHEILGELTGSQFKFQRIESVGGASFKIYVIIEGKPEPVPLQYASRGTLSILVIFGMIYEYLNAVFPGVSGNELVNQQAIVFIDDLDAHLHPAWQQKIVRLLRESFPNVQFIATANSPLVVAGCLEGEAAVLRKGERGFTVHVFQQDFIGWEAKELYGKIFQVEKKEEGVKNAREFIKKCR